MALITAARVPISVINGTDGLRCSLSDFHHFRSDAASVEARIVARLLVGNQNR